MKSHQKYFMRLEFKLNFHFSEKQLNETNIMIKTVPQYIQFHVTITHHFYIQKEFKYKGLFFKSCFPYFFLKPTVSSPLIVNNWLCLSGVIIHIDSLNTKNKNYQSKKGKHLLPQTFWIKNWLCLKSFYSYRTAHTSFMVWWFFLELVNIRSRHIILSTRSMIN